MTHTWGRTTGGGEDKNYTNVQILSVGDTLDNVQWTCPQSITGSTLRDSVNKMCNYINVLDIGS